jgi:Xaa-Pro dipeptidase
MITATARPPISAELVQQHLDQAAAQLSRRQADGLLVFRSSNILGFCGVPLAPSDRLVCGLISREGQLCIIVPAFEAGMAATRPAGSELLSWDEHEDPYATVARGAAMLGIDAGTIILDKHTWLDAQRRLGAVLPGARLVPDADLIESIRIIKTPEEIAAIRAACEDTGQIYPLVGRHLAPGLSEVELQGQVISQLQRAGLSPFGDLIQGGESASIPHQPTGARRFRQGDAVIVDFVCAREGYLGDMTRTFAVGQVSDEIVAAYGVVRQAQAAALAALRPGKTCEAIDQVARSVIEDAGLGEFFTHRLGHGIGLDVHEPPYLVQGNRQRLEPGMCVTIEPGVYVPGRYGIRIEDTVAVTATGCEVLSSSVATDVSPVFQ